MITLSTYHRKRIDPYSALAVIDWPMVKRFDADEWPIIDSGDHAGDSVLAHMSPAVIEALVELRDALPADHVITPSPVWQAHVRYTGTSRHSLKIDGVRLSDATDVFLAWRHVWLAWALAQRIQGIGGIGLYLDTHLGGQSMPMLHIDTRPERILWVRHAVQGEARYVYLHREPATFFSVIGARDKA